MSLATVLILCALISMLLAAFKVTNARVDFWFLAWAFVIAAWLFAGTIIPLSR